MSKYRFMDQRNLRFRVQTANNETIVAYVESRPPEYDNIGALYYVVAVVLIYGLSIVMMIASHIRRNKQDSQLRSYLKEMAVLRKKNRREKLLEKMTDLASKSNSCNQKNIVETSLSESPQTRKLGNDTSVYGRLPTETDDETQEMLLSKNSNSCSDNDDSVFQLPHEYCIDATKCESPKTPRISPSRMTPKLLRADGKSFFHIQVINENVPL